MIRNANYIQHYGIKGMKWGVRRYQNKDGTLTAAGKKREAAKSAQDANRAEIQDRKEAYKNRRTLSDEEINTRVRRLEQEKRLKSLTEDDIAPGRSAAKKLLHSTGAKVLYTAALGASIYAGHYAMTGRYDPETAANYMFPNPNKKR